MELSKDLTICDRTNELPCVTKILKVLFGEENYDVILNETYMKFDDYLQNDETHKKLMDEYNKIFEEIYVVNRNLSQRLDNLQGNLRDMENIFFLKKGYEMGQKQSQMINQFMFCKQEAANDVGGGRYQEQT
ncbi:hypothetical protein DEAC_c43850 [Desulfosporosinus acididurans]|uniref:Uncharacterized protein n=1 Tax=Desulfosporosinus acididurans TaxID=476652 RepID=A0A0J1FJQ5_9FIRM|nr:hypothetical protein [Desulfosporosinus acididurans]KLU63699.1 hypothetical protein DEAC_c43850 [Desulfosporosinus acididurans]